ncbi:MAG: hypothetical protein P8K64_06655 [Acidimicrobiales bacterium]|nr:hypothetical protein [Acidimicrobiales bacterium]
MGLVARALEATGISTLVLTAAHSITKAANPPRAAYVDMPLGYTAGKPHDEEFQKLLLRTALDAGTAIESPGTVIDTAIKWSNDPSWKERASSGLNNGVVSSEGDTRSDRTDIPQYQSEEDREAAEA